MSEVVEPRASGAGTASTTTSTGTNPTTSRLKKLTSGSTWISPFRASTSRKNLHKEYKEQNAIDKVQVPKKFASHPTLEAIERAKQQETKKQDLVEKKQNRTSTASSTRSLKGEPIDGKIPEEQADVESERPIEVTSSKAEGAESDIKVDVSKSKEEVEGATKTEEAIEQDGDTDAIQRAAEGPDDSEKLLKADDTVAEANDDNIEQQVKETPIEIVTQPEAKYEPVQLPEQEVLGKLQDQPKLLDHYQALSAAAIGSVSRTLDDPNKIIDLGSGMKMTQQQLLDIAARRVGPVLANINEEVSKTRNEDEIKRQQDLSNKVKGHEKKLQGEFEKHLKKIDKQKEKFNKEIDAKLDDLTILIKNADIAAANFEKTTKQEIETANEEYKDRELKAVEKHANDKETLIKNHEELEATKKQELEDSKINQEKTTQEIEELQERKTQTDNSNSELLTRIEDLSTLLTEKEAVLNDLKFKHSEKQDMISKNLSTKEELDSKIDGVKKELANKKSKHDALVTEIGVLSSTLATYTSKARSLAEDKENRKYRLAEAKNHYKEWEQEKQDMAKEIAIEHERKRVEAQEAAETKRVQDELERQRLEREAAEKEERERLLRLEVERQEAERLKNDPEYQSQLRIKQRELDQQILLEEKAEKDRIYNERKQKEEEEALTLQKEIEELKAQNDAKANEERLEAERLAQAKLNEIEKLKEEHDARLKLYQQRLEFEELQKTRLLEEVENLKKIRELREEKARLAAQVTQNSQLQDIQKLIEERELEIAKLSKQIELDDEELYHGSKKNGSSFLAVSNDLLDESSKRANHERESKQLFSSPANLQTNGSSSKNNVSKTVPSAVAGIATANVLATGTSAILEDKSNGSVNNHNGSSDIKRSGSISQTFKRITKKFGNKNGIQKSNELELVSNDAKTIESPSKNASEAVNNIPVNISKQPEGASSPKNNLTPVISSEYETYSVYEEISDSEFEAHKEDPNYLEVTIEEFEKHKGEV